MVTHEQIRLRNSKMVAEASDMTTGELAHKYQITSHQVSSVLRKHGVKAKKSTKSRRKELWLTKENEKVVEMLEQGIMASKIAKQLGISRQRVYQIKDKAVDLGKLKWQSTKIAQIKTCPVCSGQFVGSNKSCSRGCANQLISLTNTKNSKWSRNTFSTLVCKECGKSFKRSNFLRAIRERADTKSDPTNNFFCGRSCNVKFQSRRGAY